MSGETQGAGDTKPLASSSRLDPLRALDLNGPGDRPFEPLPPSVLDRPIFEIFAAVAARMADAIALSDGTTELRYGELLHQARRLANQIARTVAPGEPVGIAVANGVKSPVAMLAALAAGRPFVPLDPTFPRERNALILRQAGMRAVIVDDEARAAVRAMDDAVPLIDSAGDIADGSDAPLSPSPDDDAYIIYTSGSEGRPKGVHFAQRSLLQQAAVRINAMHLSPVDRQILLVAPTAGAAQGRLWGSLLCGAELVIVDLRRHGLQEAARVMAQRAITSFAAPPYVFRRLMELCRDPASVASVRLVNVSSDRVFASDVTLFRERFPKNCLFATNVASTEAGIYCSWFVPNDLELNRPLLPVGFAAPGHEVNIVDEDGQPVPRGKVGEITVTSGYIAQGYWRDEALTRRTFSVDPLDPKRRINRTGDLGCMQPDGLVELVGRKDRQLKIRGYRVEPTEIEASLRAHPAIRDAAIIPRPASDGVEIVAYATAQPDLPAPMREELSRWLTERLPQAMRPRRIYLVPALPLLANFKPDILKLQEFDRERAASEAEAVTAKMQAPVSGLSIRDAVRSRWERVLGSASFASDLSWEESGGDSLKALELVFVLEEMLSRPVSMALVGPTTRPSELIAALEGAKRHAAGEIASSAGGMRLFFCPGFTGLVFHEANFVQALARHTAIEVLDYPPVVPTRLHPITFDDIVTHVTNAIRAQWSGVEPLGLLGFSFGGYVAFAAASRLKAEGVDLAYLGIVDICAPGLQPAPTDMPLREVLNTPRGWMHRPGPLVTAVTQPRYALDRLVTFGIANEEYTRLAWLWRVLVLFGLRRAQIRFRARAMRLLRGLANARHRYVGYKGPICLFYALDNKAWTGLPDDLGWSDYCTSLEIGRVPGDHVGMLAPEHIDNLTRAIVSQCQRSVVTQSAAELESVEP